MTNQSTTRPFVPREYRLDDIPAITGTTGVLPEHRGRGVAMALKLLSFRYAAKRRYREVRAHNDTANPPILRMNEKLGYHRLPGWLQWEKLPHRDQAA